MPRLLRSVVPFGLLAVLLTSSGCAGLGGLGGPFPKAPVQPAPGGIYANYKAPLQISMQGGTKIGSKSGESSSLYFREPFFGTSYAWGDVSIKTAAQNGGISEVHHADYEVFQILGIFGRLTVHASGE